MPVTKKVTSAAAATAAAPSLKLLNVKFRQIQISAGDIWRFVDNFQEECSTSEIEVRLEELDSLWERFNDALVDIQSHEDFDEFENTCEKDRLLYSEQYYHAKSFLMDRIKERRRVPENEQTSRANESLSQSTLDHVRLPQIKLQTFNGDIEEWLSFRDLYTSLIHWKPDLPEVEKFHYLKGCLQGEPKALIDPLKITQANYQIAWDLLVKRYNNNKQLRKRQVQALFQLPTLTKESVTDLHVLLEGFERIVQTLDQIVQPVDYKDLLLVQILSSRLDPVTRRGWEEFSANEDQDLIKNLTEFLQRRVRVLESLPAKPVEQKLPQQQLSSVKPKPFVRRSFNTVQTFGKRCVACASDHPLYQCSSFQRMAVADREKLLRTNQLCRNCFNKGHKAVECRSKYSCRHCKGRHHSLVCFDHERAASTSSEQRRGESTRTDSDTSSTQVTTSAATVTKSANTSQCSAQILLATAVVVLEDDYGNRYPARALLDSGSESNLLTERMSQRLKVPRERVDISVIGIGQASTRVKQRIRASVRSRISEFERSMSFLVLPKVTANLPVASITTKGWKIPKGIELADPSFSISGEVDIVLGIEAFFEYFDSGKKIHLGAGLPTLNYSVFGWVVCGGISQSRTSISVANNSISAEESLESLMTRFWSLEEVESPVVFSPEEARCETLFTQTVQRQPNGRYTVTLPKNENVLAQLGESKEIALRRFLATERRLARDENLRSQYIAFMEEYVSLGHMRMVHESDYESAIKSVHGSDMRSSNESVYESVEESAGRSVEMCENESVNESVDKSVRSRSVNASVNNVRNLSEGSMGKKSVGRCYLPHHPVVKEASTTTKLRVVFDASCKTSSGISLNDSLLVGPVVQEDLRSIILRCRTKQFMIVADVEKMFRQIEVHRSDQSLQSILWRSSPTDEISTYELCTVTYGTKPAPFLATRTLRQLAMDEEVNFPLAARAVLDDTYMDDVITGTDDASEAGTLRSQLDDLMSSGGFRLRKYASNCLEILGNIPQENLAIPCSEGTPLDPNPSVKTLGLTWMPVSDEFSFQFSLQPLDDSEPITKRRILAIIATLFDPLGLLGATIASAKIFMQLLWTLQDQKGEKLNWDQQVPQMVGEQWKKYHQQLPLLNQIKLNRCVIIPQPISIELHYFSDASEKAYGACAYVRSQNRDGQVHVSLLTSKSRVAPLKCQSIPRLELCGALVAAELNEQIKRSVKMSLRTVFWTDSTCVLRWLQSIPSTWTTFVANRVSKIQTLTEGCQWNHVAGKENPADLISRGITPEEIVNNQFWWNGPSWLSDNPDSWPITTRTFPEGDEENERRRSTIAATGSEKQEFNRWYISHFSSYTKLIRCTAIWMRLCRLLKRSEQGFTSGFLRTVELAEAEHVLVRLVQRECFNDELKALSNGDFVSRRSPLRWFNPFLENKSIKLGGRLKNSLEPETFKHPLVLPAQHCFTKLLFRHYHEKLLHGGPQLMLSAIRQRFWPLGGRSGVRNVVHQCLRCFKTKPTPIQQFMGELPTERVTASRPFTKTGVDYFGPIYVRPGPRKPASKAYVALFVCLSTKAVHLELVSDLSTDRFLQALRRFIGRWGRIADIFSDNGTNFIGAKNYLQEIHQLFKSKQHQEKVSKHCADEGIQWHLNPPRAPHFGGLWEAAVRSAKHHILRVIGDQPLPFEDMNTLLVQVESCLNSRPITQLTDDPNDLEPLTPSHFWLGSSLQCLPERDLRNVATNRLNNSQIVQQKLQQIWSRWKQEYLCQLQARTKRWNKPVKIEVGKLVVICDDNSPSIHWKMGRIHEVHPGLDGVVRVVTLKTATGFKTRAVERLCLLPVQPER
ncbi:uncharacterized protein LOC129760191 [Uranotaenia lowii]|uniref:uncharacterized protein LOC129760191 n=1 Tax=Uranotaenia lowii TaxID=190385 RepID=UPI00247A5601|nr:uncharacterized protein LOC129760191 [Uranotaenia lowii]